IPAYNAAKYLPRLLASAKAQTEPFDEICVYDDCSTDETGTVAAALGMKPPQFLKPGQTVELSIEGLGTQKQVTVADAGPGTAHAAVPRASLIRTGMEEARA
ncbi:MAG: glycosyltransferase, partial [Tagaea sp.]